MHCLDYESQENSIVQNLLWTAQFTRFTMILMSLVILQVFAAYKRKRIFSIMGHLETWFSESWKNFSSHLFYGDFHPCSTFCKFGPENVTGKLDFPKVAGNSWNHLFYDDF